MRHALAFVGALALTLLPVASRSAPPVDAPASAPPLAIVDKDPTAQVWAASDVGLFDGTWMTTISCPDAAGAMGFSFEVPTQVENSVLHGERLKEGQPGRLVLDGQIQPNGHAELYAKGLVGAPQFAVGQRPKGTDYGYHVIAQFDRLKGTGTRVEGRHCDLTFVKR